MRYAGQNYELPVPVPEGTVATATIDALAEGFAAAHKRMYGFAAEGEPVQLVTFRIEATGIVRKAALQPRREARPDASGAIVGRREVWLVEEGRWVACPVYDGALLRPGNVVAGPAIVEYPASTVVLSSGQAAVVDALLDLSIRRTP